MISARAPLWSVSSLNDHVLPESTSPDYDFEYVDISNVAQNHISEELEVYSFKEAPSRARRLAEAGDVLISTVRTYLRAIAQVEPSQRNRVYSTGFAVLHPISNRADSRYLSYVMTSDVVVDEIIATSTGVSYPAIQGSALHRLRIPYHDIETQRRIAAYLDRETAEIDAMIDKLGELDKVLRSRHSSDVTKAVIGDGSGVTRKTGNTWIPEIPSHWNLATVRLVSKRVTDGSHVSPETENGIYDFVSTRDINNGVIEFEGSLKTSESSYEELVRGGCQPFDGDLLYSKDGTIGETAIVDGAHEFVVASSLIIVTPDPEIIDVRYLNHVLKSEAAQEAARSYSRGAGLPRLSIWNFSRGVPIPVPPLEQQRRIADHLDEVTSKIDAMLAKVAKLKDLLTERRAALINAVVTGRKDVA